MTFARAGFAVSCSGTLKDFKLTRSTAHQCQFQNSGPIRRPLVYSSRLTTQQTLDHKTSHKCVLKLRLLHRLKTE